jgi:hypothetical protein
MNRYQLSAISYQLSAISYQLKIKWHFIKASFVYVWINSYKTKTQAEAWVLKKRC